MEWAVIDATGQTIALNGVLVGHVTPDECSPIPEYRFDDVHLYYDTASLLVQLALT